MRGPASALVAFAILRAVTVVHRPLVFPDTVTYFTIGFLGEQQRLWTVPLIWKIFGTNDLREAVQLVLGIVAWTALAVAVWRTARTRWVKWIGLVAILLLGLVPQIAGWDGTLLSESISSSLLILVVAFLLEAARDPTWFSIAGAVVCALLWMFTRQLNVLLYLSLLPFVLLFLVTRVSRRRRVVLIPAVLLIGVWGGISVAHRSGPAASVATWNALQILENRIAGDPRALGFFYAEGLPRSPVILQERNRFPGDTSPLFKNDRIMSWAANDFNATYARYLFRHWRYFVSEPLVQLPRAISTPVVGDIQTRRILPPFLQGALWSASRFDLAFWVLAALVLVAVSLRRILRSRPAWVLVLLALFVLTGSLITYNTTGYPPGDVTFSRLFLPVGLTLHVAIILALVISVDSFIQSQDRRSIAPESAALPTRPAESAGTQV